MGAAKLLGASAADLATAPAEPHFAAAALNPALQRYVCTLWSRAPALATGGATPHIADGLIHLPAWRAAPDAASAWHWYRAAAAHAAAHLAFSPPVFEATGLVPVARVLFALLEDARAEALACRELPGLRALWSPLHWAQPSDGDGFEALMQRLSRALLDPGYHDPHPWVAKGRRLFFIDAAEQVLALRRPDELRQAAALLSHDIGQMRLRFNPKTHVPGPDYRDDHRWMWPSPQHPLPDPSPTAPRSGDVPESEGGSCDAAAPLPVPQRYPEWDRLISRLRRDWCAVYEQRSAVASLLADATGAEADHAAELADADTDTDTDTLARLRRMLRRRRVDDPAKPHSSPDGECINLDALVRARVAQRLGGPAEARVFLRSGRSRPPGRALLLIDQSASSALVWGRGAASQLDASRRIAALAARALQSAGTDVAVSGFQSNGRHRIEVNVVKGFADTLDAATWRRLAALRSGQSTRLGAALRHATRALLARGLDGTRQLLLISDGEPYDVDVHDPAYLREDARQAVLAATRAGVSVACIVLDPQGAAAARRIFGARRVGVLEQVHDLPRLVRRLAL